MVSLGLNDVNDIRIENLLSIIIITYNRAELLKRTLKTLMDSPLNQLQITVLNNKSTDHTLNVCKTYNNKPNFKVITNKFNIGGSGNILRAYEYADKPYVWIMSDDDIYDFSDLNDFYCALKSECYDIIHLGCTEKDRLEFRGVGKRIKEFVTEGYNYFKLSSNISCNVIKKSLIEKYIIASYENVVNNYPHMPLLLGLYENNAMLYVTKRRIVSIVLGSNNYSFYEALKWWIDTSYLLTKSDDRRKFIKSQFEGSESKVLAGCFLSYLKNRTPSIHTIFHFWKNVSITNKMVSILLIPFSYLDIITNRKINKVKLY